MDNQALFWDVLEERRSIRKFKPDMVPAEMVKKILYAGVLAPNARNRQSWRFVILSVPEAINSLAETLNENYRKDMLAAGKPTDEVEQLLRDRKRRLCAAPVIVIIFIETAVLSGNTPQDTAGPEYLMAVQSAALAGGQMLLAAQALGLGGLWMGGPLHAQAAVRKNLNLPASWFAQGMLLFGFPDELPPKKERLPLDAVAYFY